MRDSGRTLPRPTLPPDADTNSASAYYQLGTRLVRFDVKLDTAEMALYWASQLDPSWAEPLFVRSLIPLRALRRDAFETWLRTRSVRAVKGLALTPRQLQVVDSLQGIAWQRNPFMFTDLEFRGLERGPMRRGRLRDPVRLGLSSFSLSNFRAADSLLAIGLQEHPEDVGVRIYRARALFQLGRYDSAVAELEMARDTVRRRAEARFSPLLPPVEIFDFAIGVARVQQDDFPAARAAFERALEQNLAFYWAHTRLAGSALALHDTATALSELEMAVQIEGRDPVLRLYNGVVLQEAGRLADAEVQLRHAIELDPYYAAPYYWLAVNYQKRGNAAAAREQYASFFAHAARDHPYRAQAVREFSALGGAVADSR
ncbi:MAG TPA: tetratricopeptide repeat protein [Gemmatimonadales bacterium]|nr:tetratricopeptide repeat protein [Gemmatimonadales bacterium]